MRHWLFVLIWTLYGWCAAAQSYQDVSFPCYATATTTLNVRQNPRASATRIGRLNTGDRVVVVGMANDKWGQIKYSPDSLIGYIHMGYVELSAIPATQTTTTSSKKSDPWYSPGNIVAGLINIVLYIVLLYFGLIFLAKVLLVCGVLIAQLLSLAVTLINIPFRILNWMQRFLAKPWRIFIKYNYFGDSVNRILRIALRILQLPIYIALFPLRFVLACYYNLALHCVYEWINYILEVVMPKRYEEGYDDWWKWTYMLPQRILKYLCWHGILTIIESIIWTIIDSFLPALTLYHGTDIGAAQNILSSPDRTYLYGRGVSHWVVGGGNYAGNGIYFAPIYSTANHYSEGVVILCRVTLGRTLDLGLAPKRVYYACGHPNATIATQWGLNNGYVTGEWWRSDAGWWEYCMYDWQNRYNYSWRIRPIYVMPPDGFLLQRIPGGMYHWLFRRIVLEDMWQSIRELPERMKLWWKE